MITSHLSLTLPYRESATYASPLRPARLRMWYASGVLEHIVWVVAAILRGWA